MNGSPPFNLNSTDMKRLGVSFLKYVGSAAAVAAIAFIGQHYKDVNFGQWGAIALPLVPAALGWVTDLVHKYLSDTDKP